MAAAALREWSALARLADPRRTRRRQDARRRRMGEGHGARAPAICTEAHGAHRACRRTRGGCARCDDRRRIRHSRRAWTRVSGRAGSRRAGASSGTWRRGAGLFGRRSGKPARAAIRRRLVRRTRQMALRQGDMGHAAIWIASRRLAAPARDDDAASAAAA